MIVALLALALGCGDKAGDSAASFSPRDPATYMFMAGDALWVAPPGASAIVPDHPVFVGVQDNGPAAVHLTVAWGDGSRTNPRQNVGRKTLELGVPIDRASSRFEYGPKDIDQEGDDVQLIIEDLAVSGTLSESSIHDLVLTGSLDAAGLYAAAGESSADAFCTKLGAPCSPCSDGGSRCVPFEAHAAKAVLMPDDFPYYSFASGSWCAGVLVLPIGGALLRRARRKAAA
jgi:hypothetical protein